MLVLSSWLLIAAALVGLALTSSHFRGSGESRPSTALAAVHGGLAAAGIVLLAVALTRVPGSFTAQGAGAGTLALVLFVLAALGGSYLFLGRHVRGRSLSTPVILIHALVAVVGLFAILSYVYT